MKPIYIRVLFGLLLGYQGFTALVNVSLGKWDWVAFDLACMAVVVMSWVMTERSLRGIATTNRTNQETVEHYKRMLAAMRESGDEEGQRYALTMLSIWGWKGE